MLTSTILPHAAQPRRLLDLDGETLAAIFALAQREADESHTAVYQTLAPRRMPLVCRMLRQLAVSARKRVLLVPLLLANGTTPTFASQAEWAGYFDAVLRSRPLKPDDELRLVCSRLSPVDVGAHLDALGVQRITHAEDDDEDLGEYVTDVFGEPHIRHTPCLYAFVKCMAAIDAVVLGWRVTSVELHLCLPLRLPLGKRLDQRSPADHFMSWDLRTAAFEYMASLARLRSVYVSVGAMDPGEDERAGDARVLATAQNALFVEAWQPLAQGIAARVDCDPLELLYVYVEPSVRSSGDEDDTFDDFILKFVHEASTTMPALRPALHRVPPGNISWHMYHARPSMETDPLEILIRTVYLMHASFWVEESTVQALSLLGVERVELLGTDELVPFRPFIDDLELEDFRDAAAQRTLPMTLRCRRAPPFARTASTWLTIELA